MTHHSIPLTDGGPVYHPSHPVGFHPALRAAAHLLTVGQRLTGSSLLEDLRDEVLPLHPPTLRMLLSRRLMFSTQGAAWLGVRPRAGGLQVTLEYLDGLWRWAKRNHLLSPWILEVLGLTLAAWHATDRQSWPTHPEIPDAALRQSPTLPGPWIEALTTEPASANIAPLLHLTPEIPLVRAPEAHLPPFQVTPSAWRPEIEPYEDFKRRVLREATAAARRHRRVALRSAAERGCLRVTVRPTVQHLTWLARRQLQGWCPSEIARRHRAGVSTVHGALSALSELLELPLRPVKTGRPGL